MKGKIGLVVGLTAGYVLGARAGRERYNQIAKFASSVWHTAPVQKQVDKAKGFAKSSALALPGAIWGAAVKVTKAAASQKTAGEKLDAAVAETKKAAPAVARAAEKTAEAVSDAAEDIVEKATAAKSTPKKTTRTSKKA